MHVECPHGLLLRKTIAEGTCPLCLTVKVERLRAFVRAFDEFSAVFNGYYAGDVVDSMLAAREAVGDVSD